MSCLVILEPRGSGYEQGYSVADAFKQDAEAQIVERGYAVSEMAEWLGISIKSLYMCKAQFTKSPGVMAETFRYRKN